MRVNLAHISKQKNISDIEKTLNSKYRKNVSVPRELYKRLNISEMNIGNLKCFEVLPKSETDGTFILYLYGGLTCLPISDAHWDFIKQLCLATGKGIVVPMYPLAPENSCKDVFDALREMYKALTARPKVKSVSIVGDSQGAGLVLSLGLAAWRHGYKKPEKAVLLSPIIDTEFLDVELEKQHQLAERKQKYTIMSEPLKEFINTRWIKNFATRFEYTSPFYEDFTDVFDSMYIFTGSKDVFNIYAHEFYSRMKKQGVSVKLFEFEGEKHGYFIDSNSNEKKKAFSYLTSILLDNMNEFLMDYYPIKLMADWSKKCPDVIKDEWAVKYIYNNNFDFSPLKTKMSEYNYYRMAATYSCCDQIIRKYIDMYPFGTIVNIGCNLDNMFGRVDNGKIKWYSVDTHNMMSLRREVFGERAREKTIGREFDDLSWVDDIKCDKSKGIIFICNENMTHYSDAQVKSVFDKIYTTYPGAKIVFTVSTWGVNFITNCKGKNNVSRRFKRNMYINDTEKIVNDWNIDYKLIIDEPVFKYLPKEYGKKLFTKFRIMYNKITHNHRVLVVKLGSEVYDIKFN